MRTRIAEIKRIMQGSTGNDNDIQPLRFPFFCKFSLLLVNPRETMCIQQLFTWVISFVFLSFVSHVRSRIKKFNNKKKQKKQSNCKALLMAWFIQKMTIIS